MVPEAVGKTFSLMSWLALKCNLKTISANELGTATKNFKGEKLVKTKLN